MDKQWIEKKKSEIKSTLHKQLISVESTKTTDDYVIVSGYVNRFRDTEGNIVRDRDGDAVTPYGMDVTEYEKNPVILFQHDRNEPIGRAVKIEKREDGIYMVMHIFKALNPKVYEAVRLGALSAFSIGFKVMDLYYDEEKDIFYLVKTLLLENSIVSVPANQESLIDSVEMPDGMKCMVIHGSDCKDKKLNESKEADDVNETLKQLVGLVSDLNQRLGVLETKETKEVNLDEVEANEFMAENELEEVKEQEDTNTEAKEEANTDGGSVTENSEESEELENTEDPSTTEVALSLDSVVNLLRETKVSEENFDSLLEVVERLSTELNSFLEQNLNLTQE